MWKIAPPFAVAIAALFTFSPVAQAEYIKNLNAENAKAEVLRVAKKYAEATSCIASDYDDGYEFFEIVPYYIDPLSDIATGEYGVIWYEEPCAGGNYTALRIAFARIEGAGIFVGKDANFPDMDAVSCEVISSQPDSIVFDCLTYRDDDPNYHPTQTVTISVKRSVDKQDGFTTYGKWKRGAVVKTGIVEY